MIFELLRWWYGPGWIQSVHRIGGWTKGVERSFSVATLARTLFSPWRRIISGGGRSLDDKLRATLDNFVSRCVGFVIRFFVLIAAGFVMLGAFLAAVLITGIWPLLPLAFVFFVVRSIIG